MTAVKDLVDFYYRSNYGTFSEYLREDGYDLAFSVDIPDTFFNHAILYAGEPEEVLERTAGAFAKRDRRPAVYVTPLSSCFGRELTSEGLEKIAGDVWMSLEHAAYRPALRAQKPEGLRVFQIGPERMDDYLKTFKSACSNPGDVYGVLPDYYLKVEKKFFADGDSGRLKSRVFLAELGGVPVGCVRTVSEGAMCFAYALAVIKEWRKGGGIAAAISDTAITAAFEGGCEEVFLQTEAGSRLERLYRAYGFKSAFTGIYYGREK